jgi:hypothetical protein
MKFPPLAEQSCESCRYSRALLRDDDVLSCRRHAPALTDLKASDDDKTAWGWFPAVIPDGWCGEWAAAEADRWLT